MHAQQDGQEPRRWLDRPENVNKIIWGLVVVCVIAVAADFFHDKHPHYDFEKWIGFYGLYGFVSCVFLVLAAAQMRKLVMRDEDYYGPPPEEEPEDV